MEEEKQAKNIKEYLRIKKIHDNDKSEEMINELFNKHKDTKEVEIQK